MSPALRIVFVLALALAGCGQASEDRGSAAPNEPSPGEDGAEGPPDGLGTGAPSCTVDADCVQASSTCCECPSFAAPGNLDNSDTCAGVECDGEPSCSATEAACEDGFCELLCSPIVCDAECAFGFAADDNGCLVCACASEIVSECVMDSDCVQTAADCCGCAAGGVDTAVPAGGLEDFRASLMCTGDELCPEVDVCTSAEPRCRLGQCVLAEPGSGDSGLIGDRCGTSDYPSCPVGQHCVLNVRGDEDGKGAGVGLCQTP